VSRARTGAPTGGLLTLFTSHNMGFRHVVPPLTAGQILVWTDAVGTNGERVYDERVRGSKLTTNYHTIRSN
jgi:hypothetical protein